MKMADGSRNKLNNTGERILSHNQDQVRPFTSRTNTVMSHVKCDNMGKSRTYIGQADLVMSHCCAEVIDTTLKDNVSSLDTVCSIDSVSSNQVICGGLRPAASDGGIHKETLKAENQQSENTDSLLVKCADQHIAVRVEWGNIVHNCVLCHGIKAEMGKLVCILNSGSLELTAENLEPNIGYYTPSEGSQTIQTVHTGGVDQGGVDTVHPVAADQGGVDTSHPRGVDQGGVDTSHPRGVDQGEVDSGCVFFQDMKPNIKTSICSEGRGNVKSSGQKEIGNLQLTESESVMEICPKLNIKQECGGEINTEGPEDRGYWHADNKVPLEVHPLVESIGPVTPSPSPSLLSVEPRGLPLEIPNTERTLTAEKGGKRGKTLRVMLCIRGAQCYHNQPQVHLNKGLKTVKGCDDLRVQEQQLPGVQNNVNVGQVSGKGTPEGGKGTPGGGKGTSEGGKGTPEGTYQLSRNSFIENSNAEVIEFEARAQEAHTDTDNVHSKEHLSEKGLTSRQILLPHQSLPSQLKPQHRRKQIGGKPYKCNACGKGFYQTCYLEQHSKAHTLDKPVKYDVCGKRVTRKVHLKGQHVSHNGEKSSELGVLAKNASKKCSTNLHQKHYTGDEKHFECSVCRKKFSDKWYLSIHHRIHTGEKPFECTICGKRFTWKVSFQDHEIEHNIFTVKCATRSFPGGLNS